MVAIVVRGCDSKAGMLDMEPPFEKHLFVDCVFVIQVFPVRMFDEHSFAAYPGEQKFDLSSSIATSPIPRPIAKRART
jgi:hypothetical protein